MATLYMSPITMIVQYLTNIGLLAAGGTLNTYVGGTVNTPQTTFTDSTGLVNNPNPMTLPASARPATALGNPTAFWAPAGTLTKLVVTDAQSNPLVSIDNIPVINDPTAPGSITTQLANPASGQGVDLVANAVKSYAIVANVQAAPAPTLAAGQTLIIEVQGQTSPGDNGGGIYFWSSTSTATDDSGVTTIKPNAVLPANPGRYLRLNLPGNAITLTSGTFTATGNGFTAAISFACTWIKIGNAPNAMVILTIGNNLGTSNAATFTLTGIPAAIAPNTTDATFELGQGFVEDNGANSGFDASALLVHGTGNINLLKNGATNGWTNSGQKGFTNPIVLTYPLF